MTALTVSVKVPWWTHLYLKSLVVLAWLGFPVDVNRSAHRLCRQIVVTAR